MKRGMLMGSFSGLRSRGEKTREESSQVVLLRQMAVEILQHH